jgi:hypothetical protein
MLTQSNHAMPSGGGPLTHRACLASTSRETWVQVRRRDQAGPYVLCGRLIELRPGETEWFKVETCCGAVWADGRHVRMCSGDGRCTCEATRAEGPTC